MTAQQLEFPPPRARNGRRAPEVTQRELDQVLYWLSQIGGNWITADQLARHLGWPPAESSRRKIRKCAEKANGQIASAPGTPGYKLTAKCTPEDMRLIEAMRTQGREMIRRYIKIKNAWHSCQTKTLI